MNHGVQPILLAIGFVLLVLALTALARRLPIPTPILQVIAGLAIGLAAGDSIPPLEPELVFLVFLPPILWAAAYGTSLRDFKANLRPIALLSVGLVLITTLVVAVAVRLLVPDMPWAVAIALGAIVSPPDAIAAEAIITRLPVPRRVIAVLAGESLVNDAAALILYRTAVVAAVTGYFSAGEAIVRFFVDAGIGVLIGLLVGWLAVRGVALARDAVAGVLIVLIGPYVAWVAAESVHVSAVLACVAGGLYVRQKFSTAVAPTIRLQSRTVWDLFIFLLTATIFVLLGVEFGLLVESIPPGNLARVARTGLIVSGVAIAVRLLWVPAAVVLPRWLDRQLARRDPIPPASAIFLVSWTSMRGIVSLAAALGLPLALADGRPFPYRAEIILVTACVILVTLVIQGLTLEPLIRRLGFAPEESLVKEEYFARGEALRHGLEKLEDLADEPWAARADIERLRQEFRERMQRHRLGGPNERAADRRLRHELLAAERRELVRLRNEDAISDAVLVALEEELDLEALRIGTGRIDEEAPGRP
jgi:CPA1 family monovalent cation:H+ antiporter